MLPNALLSTLLLLGGPPNTTVSLSAEGALLITGDAGNNAIEVDGLRIHVGGGQTLNGVPGPTDRIMPNVPHMVVSLGDGNDALHFLDPVGDDRTFDLGAGNDWLDVSGVVLSRTKIFAGSGDDHVHNEDCVYSDLRVDLGPGRDDFEIAFSLVNGAMRISAGDGPDVVRLRSATFHGPVTATGGSGVDQFFILQATAFDEPPRVAGFENLHPPAYPVRPPLPGYASQVVLPANQSANANALPIVWPLAIVGRADASDPYHFFTRAICQ